MKILYYSSHPHLKLASPSGYGTHMREMIAAFEGLGHLVKPLIMGGTSLNNNDLKIKSRSAWKKVVADFIPSYFWESTKDYRLLNFDKFASKVLEKEVESFQPDIIYERATFLQTSGIDVARRFGIKHILEVNAPYVEERKVLEGNSFFLKKGMEAEEYMLNRSDKVVVVSSALKQYFSGTYQLKEDKFLVTPNAINQSLLNFNPAKVEQIKAKLGLSGKTVIGFVGSVFPWHGLELLIESFHRLVKERKENIHLLIVGDGETIPLLKKKVEELGIELKVTFTGSVQHAAVFKYIQLMDICVMAKSNWYGSPVKIFEYGAMGKPVIAPDNVPVRDVMQNKKTGLLTEPSVESLSAAIKLYIEDESLRLNCAKNFKKKVLSEHTWFDNAKKVLVGI